MSTSGWEQQGHRRGKKKGQRHPQQQQQQQKQQQQPLGKEEIRVEKLGGDTQECFVCREDISTCQQKDKMIHKGKHYHKKCYECDQGEVVPEEGVGAMFGEKAGATKEKKATEISEGVTEKYQGAAQEKVGEFAEGVKESIEETVSSAQAKAAEYKEQVAKLLEELREKAEEVIGGAQEHITEVVYQTVEGAQAGVQYVKEEIPVKLGELKQQAGETLADVKETVASKVEDFREVAYTTFSDLGETVQYVKGATEGKAEYAKEAVGDKMEDLKKSFLQFKENYDNFKAEAAKGHGVSLFDKAATAVSDLSAWLSGEFEEEEESEEEGLIYREGSASSYAKND